MALPTDNRGCKWHDDRKLGVCSGPDFFPRITREMLSNRPRAKECFAESRRWLTNYVRARRMARHRYAAKKAAGDVRQRRTARRGMHESLASHKLSAYRRRRAASMCAAIWRNYDDAFLKSWGSVCTFLIRDGGRVGSLSISCTGTAAIPISSFLPPASPLVWLQI